MIKKKKLDILFQVLETIFIVSKTSFNIKYKHSFLGYFWALLTPLIFAVIYFSLFSLFLKIDIDNYAIFLLTGFYPWLFLQNSIISSSRSLISNPVLIKRIRVRKFIFPISSILLEIYNFLIAIPIIILFLFLSDLQFYYSWIWQIPLLIFLQILFIYPLAIIFSVLCVYLKDVEHILVNIFQILFFLSPILYNREKIPENLSFFYNLNPVIYLIENWRNVFIYGNINFNFFLIITLISLFTLYFSRSCYSSFKDKIPELL